MFPQNPAVVGRFETSIYVFSKVNLKKAGSDIIRVVIYLPGVLA